MYTNTSRFRINGKYGLFTIPKGILNELGWNPGDLIGFWGIDGNFIHLQKMCSGKDLEKFKKEGEKYDSKFYKRIAKFGGETGTCGIKSLPEFLMKEFEPKDKQEIYFLPAKYTSFTDHFSQEVLNNIVFAAFNPENLNEDLLPMDKIKENSWRINREGKLIKDARKENLDEEPQLIKGNMWVRDRLLAIDLTLKDIKKWTKYIQKSKHKDKEELLKMHEKREILLRKEKSLLEKAFKDKFSNKTKGRNNKKKLSSS